jgi:hypothetical protein
MYNLERPLFLRTYKNKTMFDDCKSEHYIVELYKSIVNQDLRNIKKIIEYYKQKNTRLIINYQDFYGYSPYQASIEFQKEECGKEIIELLKNFT